ncbi:hypothetical protein SFRURICE_018296 [Spodoptera frugiperda]|nr:hypothetical protein SFRURICE_018296 [Spodoptera frugiperda]
MDRKSQRTTIGQKARHDHLAWSEDTPEHILRRIPTYWPQYREHARAVMSARGREVVRQFYNCAAPFFGILSSLDREGTFECQSKYYNIRKTKCLSVGQSSSEAICSFQSVDSYGEERARNSIHTSKMKYFQLETFILYAGVRIELDR